MTLSVILLAGGKGARMGGPTPKQYLLLNGKPLVQYSFDLFLSMPELSEIIVVCQPQFCSFFEKSPVKPVHFALPGEERQDSVANGFAQTSASSKHILIHDAARPLIQEKDVKKLLHEGIPVGAATLGVPMHCTVKQVDLNGLVKQTLDRSSLINIQTPQLLKREVLQAGLEKAQAEGCILTDDVSLAELIGHPVKVVMGCNDNIKITTPEDFEIVKQLAYATL